MAYIGAKPNTVFRRAPTKDSFTGDGSATTFDLANIVPAGGENALQVFIDNVRQEPGSGKAYTLGNDGSGDLKRITFSAAPASSAAIYVITSFSNEAFAKQTDLKGSELALDADGDTTITADTDDQIDIKIAGADDFQFTANTLTAQSGSTIAAQALTATTLTTSSTVDIQGQELILDGDNDTSITADTDDRIDIKVGNTDILQITNSSSDAVITQAVEDKDIIFKGDDGGSAITALTIDMSDGGILQTRAGVGFPGTQVASTGANVLDDYEEGVWTPAMTDGSNTLTASSPVGIYTKIGRYVFCNGQMATSSLNSASGTIRLTGLPFTSSSTAGAFAGGSCVYGDGLNITASMNVNLRVETGGTIAYFALWDVATGTSNMTAAEWSDDGSIRFYFSYMV